ncbi:MAG: hypothetical protein COV70_02230 [Parcubacteria group bacterium CG11_big_fil_rev_8_21_14_0_20_39_22]|nr:MAG: hypothetical protein COV70_02230 [Parcubacteria group bacterium CG11_big_fil_rev_8_21_14_0_20_39_22]
MKDSKIIFISIFEGVEAKNLLRTPVLKTLLSDENVKIILFTKTKEKAEYYKKSFNDPRIEYEVVEKRTMRGIDSLFSKLKFLLLDSKTIDLKRRMLFAEDRNFLKYYFGKLAKKVFSKKIIRKLVRYLDFYLVKDRTYKQFFDKYNPSLVFLAHLFDDPEIHLLREAKRRKIISVGFVNSWDKVTSRSILRLLPDKIIVFNKIVKQEVFEYADMKKKDIFVSGIPQYDLFFSDRTIDRDSFMGKYGLSANDKLIVYASMGKAFSDSDWDIIDLLTASEKDGLLPSNTKLLVRFQPNDFVDEGEIKKRPSLRYDYPGIRFSQKRGVDWDMDESDLNHLRNTLAHMDLLVTYASSISIDAAIFDKPVININFEINKKSSLLKSPTQYYSSGHYKKALDAGGIKMAKNERDLLESINKYIGDPSLEREGRRRLVKEQCEFTDGRSGERIGNFVLDLLYGK